MTDAMRSVNALSDTEAGHNSGLSPGWAARAAAPIVAKGAVQLYGESIIPGTGGKGGRHKGAFG